MNKKAIKKFVRYNPKKFANKSKTNRISQDSFSSIKSLYSETKNIPKIETVNSSSIKLKGSNIYQQINKSLGTVKKSIFYLNKSFKILKEKEESKNKKLDDIKTEQIKTNRELKGLKTEQININRTLKELKTEQIKTNTTLKNLGAEQIKTNRTLKKLEAEQKKTNELLKELINLTKGKQNNNNQNMINIIQN